MGPRRLADRALALAHGPRRHGPRRAEHVAGHRALEDPRQPPAQSHRAGAAGAARRGVDGAPGLARALDRARPARSGVPCVYPGGPVAQRSGAWRAVPRAPAGRRRQHPDQPASVFPFRGDAGASERRDGRCHHSRARASRDHAAIAARVGDGRPRRTGPEFGGRGLPPHVAGPRACARDHADSRHARAGPALAGPSDRRPLAGVSRPGARDGPAADAPPPGARPQRPPGASEDRPPHLALFRGDGRSCRQPSRARQLPGRSPASRRPPDLAHQHRSAAAVDAVGVRLRVSELHDRSGSPRADLRYVAAHAALSGAFLQLVRHAVPRAAGTALHLDGRQRKPGGISPHGAIGAQSDRGNRPDHRRIVSARPRGCRRPLRGRHREGDRRSDPVGIAEGAEQPAGAAARDAVNARRVATAASAPCRSPVGRQRAVSRDRGAVARGSARAHVARGDERGAMARARGHRGVGSPAGIGSAGGMDRRRRDRIGGGTRVRTEPVAAGRMVRRPAGLAPVRPDRSRRATPSSRARDDTPRN